MVYDLFNVLLDAVCQYFVENLSVYVHQRYWSEVFFLCCVFIWFWDQDDSGFIKRVWASSIFLEFLEQSVNDSGQLALKCFVKFSCETIPSRAFVCLEGFDPYYFNFVISYLSVQAFCFLFIQFWKIIFFQKFLHFTQLFIFLGIQFSSVISYNPLYFHVISCNLSSFISDCVYIGPLYFS